MFKKYFVNPQVKIVSDRINFLCLAIEMLGFHTGNNKQKMNYV